MSGHVGPEAFDLAPGPDRRAALVHLRDCAPCRARLAAEDPERLFALLALAEPAASDLEEVSRAVASRLGDARPGRIEAWRERGLPRAVPVAAAVALFALLVTLGDRGPVRDAPSVAALPSRADVRVTETAGAAHVVDLTVGETQIVMIFDPGLEL